MEVTVGSGRGTLQLRAASPGPAAPFPACPARVPVPLQPHQEALWARLGPHAPLPQPFWSRAVEQAAGAPWLPSNSMSQSFPQSSGRLDFPRVPFRHRGPTSECHVCPTWLLIGQGGFPGIPAVNSRSQRQRSAL